MNDDYTIGHGAFFPYNENFSFREMLNLLEHYPNNPVDIKEEWLHLHELCKQLLFGTFENLGLDYCHRIEINSKIICFWIMGKHYYVSIDNEPNQFNNFDTAFDYWIKQIRK